MYYALAFLAGSIASPIVIYFALGLLPDISKKRSYRIAPAD